MLFCFRLEEFQNFVGNFIVRRKRIEIGASQTSLKRYWLRSNGVGGSSGRRCRIGHAEIERRRLRGKGKAVTLLESRNVLKMFLAGFADFEKAGFQQGNAVREKLRER